MMEALEKIKDSTKKSRTVKKKGVALHDPPVQKVVTAEEINEETRSNPDDSRDSDYDSIFGGWPNNDDESEFKSDDVDSDMEKNMSASRARVIEKGVVYLNKGKRVMMKKPVPKSTDKRKRSYKPRTKGSGPTSKFTRTSGAPRVSIKGAGPPRKGFTSNRK
ncbi:hypothetical protein FXO38_14143 [Capsicum annuum]|nr:hypothetical protein FXO38_14143 [Capsicum annuum]KAF3658658.1 hypothetical protein FXO37_14320 [Capsicum annuum]